MAQQQRRGQGGGGYQQRAPKPVDATVAQVGSRWIGERPSGEDFAKWFRENVKLHEGLDPEKYIGGIVLIEGKETFKKVIENEEGTPGIVDHERLGFTPYAKVDVRVAYFWDLIALHPDWIGVIEPAAVSRITAQGFTNLNLPPGFFRHQVEGADGNWTQFVGCSMQVRVYDRNDSRIEVWHDETGEPQQKIIGKPILQSPAGTKLVAAIGQWDKIDPFAIMKAETGAVGRGLGMAGMLVIPGSGIATAEDVQEAEAAPTAGSLQRPSAETLPAVQAAPAEAAPELPAVPESAPVESTPPADTKEDLTTASEGELRASVERNLLALRERHPTVYATTKEWWEQDRALGDLNQASIQALQSPMLRGVARKIERTLAEAEHGTEPAQAAPAEETAQPATPGEQ